MPKKGKKSKKSRRTYKKGMEVRHFKKVTQARAAAKGHWGTHVQYVRKTKSGYALYRYRK